MPSDGYENEIRLDLSKTHSTPKFPTPITLILVPLLRNGARQIRIIFDQFLIPICAQFSEVRPPKLGARTSAGIFKYFQRSTFSYPKMSVSYLKNEFFMPLKKKINTFEYPWNLFSYFQFFFIPCKLFSYLYQKNSYLVQIVSYP
jgi:hypothetical protein